MSRDAREGRVPGHNVAYYGPVDSTHFDTFQATLNLLVSTVTEDFDQNVIEIERKLQVLIGHAWAITDIEVSNAPVDLEQLYGTAWTNFVVTGEAMLHEIKRQQKLQKMQATSGKKPKKRKKLKVK